MNIVCVILAAGDAKRFGENKLLREVDGKSLICRALEAVPAEHLKTAVVVTQYPDIAALAKEYCFTPIINAHPEWGQSYSIKLGLAALEHCDAVLFQVADQPLLKQETVVQLIALYQQHPNSIVCLSHDGIKGNPCLFPARFFPELMALEGDRGGRGIRQAHDACVVTLEAPNEELRDIDTLTDLEQLKN